MQKTGIKTAPRPKPENRVSNAVKNAVTPIKKSSMIMFYINIWIVVEYNPCFRSLNLSYLLTANFYERQLSNIFIKYITGQI
jgi:hypothetical protein